MTRKDYELLALAMGQAYVECKNSAEQKGAELVVEHVAHALQLENPRFKPGVFARAVRAAIVQFR